MNILIVGNGKGSWTMRGEQLGAAIGARVRERAAHGGIDPIDLTWADVVVLVKRSAVPCAPACHAAKVPIVWDALDFWSQPGENTWPESAARERFGRVCDVIKPAVVIGATRAMRAAVPPHIAAAYVPHHSWAGLFPTPPTRDRVHVVAYQGNPVYLGSWAPAVAAECARRGWVFVINPTMALRGVDLFVALRDQPWDGFMCQEWKSGVKLVNALAAGRPVITQASAAAREILPPGSWVATAADLPAAFDAWTDPDARADCAAACVARSVPYTIDHVAAVYQAALQGIACPA